jgi:ribosomal protein L33
MKIELVCKQCGNKIYKAPKNNKPKRKRGELLGYPKRAISSQAGVGMLRKVQRLTAESRTDSNADTSSPAERHDIVRAYR